MTRRYGWAGATLHSRLTLIATAVVALVLLASALALVAVQQRLLTRGVDEALVQRADNAQAAVEREPAGTVLPGEGDREDSFLQLLNADGRVVAASANVASLTAVGEGLTSQTGSSIHTVRVRSLSGSDRSLRARSEVPRAPRPWSLPRSRGR